MSIFKCRSTESSIAKRSGLRLRHLTRVNAGYDELVVLLIPMHFFLLTLLPTCSNSRLPPFYLPFQTVILVDLPFLLLYSSSFLRCSWQRLASFPLRIQFPTFKHDSQLAAQYYSSSQPIHPLWRVSPFCSRGGRTVTLFLTSSNLPHSYIIPRLFLLSSMYPPHSQTIESCQSLQTTLLPASCFFPICPTISVPVSFYVHPSFCATYLNNPYHKPWHCCLALNVPASHVPSSAHRVFLFAFSPTDCVPHESGFFSLIDFSPVDCVQH